MKVLKVLLVAINAKYIHSNLAVLSIKAFAHEYKDMLSIAEYSINQHTDFILQDIYRQKPDVVAFSCYIWNMDIIEEVSHELKKILPNTQIWFGGPEVSYEFYSMIQNNHYLKGIIIGEGEVTFKEIAHYYINKKNNIENNTIKKNISLSKINGIIYKDDKGNIVKNGERECIDINLIPFPYEDISKYNQKIIYYESSRGCPYSCSYCLSSANIGVRFRDINLIKEELMIFLNNNVSQVKFVDRTFNCNKELALSIWRFIKENDNGVTNFHFEISADLLEEEELLLLAELREGLVQLEVGVQTINPETISAINRVMNLDRLSESIIRINAGKNIHQHLDLIAGLPYEGYISFRNSFNYVYALQPNQLQLGFLKVLKGSGLFVNAMEYGIVYKDTPNYEVLYTKWLTYDEILKLKAIENMVEVYYNTAQFTYSIKYLEGFYDTPFDLYEGLADYYDNVGFRDLCHSRMQRYDILLDFVQSQIGIHEYNIMNVDIFKEILVYDLYLRENLKSRPVYASDNAKHKRRYRNFYENHNNIEKYLPNYMGYNVSQIVRMAHIECFSIDIEETFRTGIIQKKDTFVLFDYSNRNKLSHDAKTTIINI